MQTTEYLYELLVRGKPGGISGAHQIRATEYRKDDGSLLTTETGVAKPLVIGSEEWTAVIGQTLNDALAELEAVKVDRDAALARVAELTMQLAAMQSAGG